MQGCQRGGTWREGDICLQKKSGAGVPFGWEGDIFCEKSSAGRPGGWKSDIFLPKVRWRGARRGVGG